MVKPRNSPPTKQSIRPRALGLVAGIAAAALVTGMGTAYAAPQPSAPTTSTSAAADPDDTATTSGAPTLTPKDGAYLEGTVTVASNPTAVDDSVTGLAIDGQPIEATTTTGVSQLSYDVGDNSSDARYGNYVLINGEHRIEMPSAASERVTLDVPNEVLVQGDNTVTFHAGTREGTCGTNYDDFVLSNLRLELLGEEADGDGNEFNYNLGDGSCGSNTSLLTEAELTFTTAGDPQRTTGLSTELDTSTLTNGSHEITATTASGAATVHTVTVNNAPAGAPRLLPIDGTLTRGVQPVFAFLPDGRSGEVTDLTVDGERPQVAETLAPGTATLAFSVATNAIEARYYNHLLVNGHRVEIGGDWVSEQVQLAIPNHFLVPGENTITVVTGDINGTAEDGSRCANRDDFTLTEPSLSPATGTATGVGVQDTYDLGDGVCGSDPSRLAEAELRFTVADAQTTRLRPTLGGGDATVRMHIGGNGAEAKFGNVVRINGMEVEIGDVFNETVDLLFPNEWLHPGTNTVEILAGPNSAAACGDNYDDFPVSELSLTPASGTATPAYKQTNVDGAYQPISIGDGSCGSSYASTTVTAIPFTVDAPAAGLRADVDTARLPDGDHTLAATSSDGLTATRLLVSDNTAPELVGSTPAKGQHLVSGVVFEADVEDASGTTAEPVYELDGEPILPGALIGPGLSAGEHTLTVQAEDSLGNRDTQTVTFTSAGIPAVPTDLSPGNDTREAPGTVSLEATVAHPDGRDVTARFTEAEIVNPTQGYAGTTTTLPTTLEVAGEESVEVAGLVPLDGETLEAPTTRDISFQRFDVPVPPNDEAPIVRWSGTIDPERVATLRAWDRIAGEWIALASSRGTFEDSTTLSARVSARFVDGGNPQVVHVLVTGEDPFADDIEPGDPEAFADPASYDFSLAHFTDTQYLAEGAVEQETEAERAIWKQAYGDTTQWLADNAQQRKIAHVMHTGDIIQNNINPPTTPEMEQQIIGEFEVASELHTTLDTAGIPSQVVAGNHDNQRGTETGPGALYNTYFGPERYASADDQWATAEYGGPWREGDSQNNYVLFSAGGLEFISIGLSYGVTKEEANWADGLLKQYSDRNAILLTHDYLTPSSNPNGRESTLAGDGSAMYQLLVEPNPNVFLVLAGHRHGVGTNVKPEVGEVGHGVVELLADYQAYTVSAEEVGLTEIGGYAPDEQLRFGASFMRLLEFDVDRSEMIVETYSPFLDNFGATEYSGADRNYDGTEDEMVLPVDLTSRTTSFTTESMSVFVPRDEIGSDIAVSGEVAGVDWTGLVGGTTYGWIVTAESAAGGRTQAEPGVLRTQGKSEPKVTLSDPTVKPAATMTVEVEVAADGQPVADGSVELRSGRTTLGAAEVVDGVAAIRLADPLQPGRHRLVAAYSGSDWVAASETPLTLTVTKPAMRTSTVTARPARKQVRVHQMIEARVQVKAGRPAPTGRVEIRYHGRVVATRRLDDQGRVVVRWSAGKATGKRTYQVRYLGSSEVEPDRTTFVVRVVRKR